MKRTGTRPYNDVVFVGSYAGTRANGNHGNHANEMLVFVGVLFGEVWIIFNHVTRNSYADLVEEIVTLPNDLIKLVFIGKSTKLFRVHYSVHWDLIGDCD